VGSFFPEIKRSEASSPKRDRDIPGKNDARLDGRVLFGIAGADRVVIGRQKKPPDEAGGFRFRACGPCLQQRYHQQCNNVDDLD
jgi:hypothetical protein